MGSASIKNELNVFQVSFSIFVNTKKQRNIFVGVINALCSAIFPFRLIVVSFTSVGGVSAQWRSLQVNSIKRDWAGERRGHSAFCSQLHSQLPSPILKGFDGIPPRPEKVQGHGQDKDGQLGFGGWLVNTAVWMNRSQSSKARSVQFFCNFSTLCHYMPLKSHTKLSFFAVSVYIKYNFRVVLVNRQQRRFGLQ